MTDPEIGVGEAAARAPRLEPVEKWRRRLLEPEQHWAPPDLLREIIADLEAARAPREPLEPAPIPLNAEQEQAATTWAADDRLWTTQETVAFNLRTFARVILAAARSALPPPQHWSSCNHCATATWCQKFELCLSESHADEHPEIVRAALPRVPEPDLGLDMVIADGLTIKQWAEKFGVLSDRLLAICKANEDLDAVRQELHLLYSEVSPHLRAARAAEPPRVPVPDLKALIDAWRIEALAVLRAARAGAEAPPQTTKHDDVRYAPGMNADDHLPMCDILTTRDGWDADCTCGEKERRAASISGAEAPTKERA